MYWIKGERQMKKMRVDQATGKPDPAQLRLGHPREKWNVGTHVSVYSVSASGWCPAVILAVDSNDLVVQSRTPQGTYRDKTIDRYDAAIRPPKAGDSRMQAKPKKKSMTAFHIGDEVKTKRWTGDEFFQGSITVMNAANKTYVVKYSDGTVWGACPEDAIQYFDSRIDVLKRSSTTKGSGGKSLLTAKDDDWVSVSKPASAVQAYNDAYLDKVGAGLMMAGTPVMIKFGKSWQEGHIAFIDRRFVVVRFTYNNLEQKKRFLRSKITEYIKAIEDSDDDEPEEKADDMVVQGSDVVTNKRTADTDSSMSKPQVERIVSGMVQGAGGSDYPDLTQVQTSEVKSDEQA